VVRAEGIEPPTPAV